MQFSEVYYLPINKVPKDLYKKMYRLNYGFKNRAGYGFRMAGRLVACRQNNSGHVHFILDERNRLAAWALTFSTTNYRTYFYTRCQYRRRGLGKRLYNASQDFVLKHYNKESFTISWDPRSRLFFQKVKSDRKRAREKDSNIYR